jgi:hypothetical protein
MKTRLIWFVGGAAVGAAGAGAAKRKVAETAERLRPRNVAHATGGAVRRSGRRVVDAVRDGVVTARRRERVMIAEREGRLVRLAEHLEEGDELYVDGQAVETARVIVMRRRDGRGR